MVYGAGGRRLCMRYSICYDATWINKLVPAFPTPAPRKHREGRGTHCVADASKFKSLGPATKQTAVQFDCPVRRFLYFSTLRIQVLGGVPC